jgi:DNA-binding IclR family transcriptional regulator
MGAMSISRMDMVSKAKPATGSPKALIKGLALVDLVAAADRPVRLVRLVEASGLPRATALRLLDALVEHGLLLVGDAGYGPGPQLAVWGQRYLDGLDVREHAEDLMRALAEDTRETCYLGVRDGRQVLYIAKADSPQAIRAAARVGSRNPLHSTGLGKALLAFGPPDVLEEYVRGPLERKTPNTITEPEELFAELDRIRARGWSIDDVENEDGVRCVAGPVRDHAGAVVAAISIVAPAFRFAPDDLPRLAPKVLAAAGELSRRIGHPPAHARAAAQEEA